MTKKQIVLVSCVASLGFCTSSLVAAANWAEIISQLSIHFQERLDEKIR